MAVFPQGKTRVCARANAGEKRVLDTIACHLEDDYVCWHNIPIMGSGREPDFVILHPQRGLLMLEVKDWTRATHRLCLSAMGTSPIVDVVEKPLDNVQRAYR